MSAADNWAPYLSAFPAPDPVFTHLGYTVGQVPPPEASALRQAITAAPGELLRNEEREGIEAPKLKPAKLSLMNERHVHRAFTEDLRRALRDALRTLGAPIAKALRTPWRVLACRSWTTEPGATGGPNDWHRDGGIVGIMKIMIYSSRTGHGYGGLLLKTADGKIATISGPAGLWVLFQNSRIEHRGVAPTLPDAMRVATEITIAPAQAFDLEPRFFGHNVRYPIHP